MELKNIFRKVTDKLERYKSSIGYIALGLLLTAYLFYVLHKELLFQLTNSVATLLFVVYSYLQRDIVFLIANAFIFCMLVLHLLQT